MVPISDRIIDVLHLSSTTGVSLSTHPAVEALNVGVSVAALGLGLKALTEEGFEAKAEAVALLSYATETGLELGAHALHGPASHGLHMAAKGAGVVHGVTDIVMGVHAFKEGQHLEHKALMAVGALEVGMGSALIGAVLTNGSWAKGLQLGAFGIMIAKQLVVHTD